MIHKFEVNNKIFAEKIFFCLKFNDFVICNYFLGLVVVFVFCGIVIIGSVFQLFDLYCL